MTPAEKRVKELIDRWLTSLDLHLQYVDLKDSAYNNVQPWPVHDRPTRWVLEHAKQKVLELHAAFESRIGMGDAKFAESVELIVFLANLVGIQHVQRFIPLADPDRHGVSTLTELDGLKPVTPPTSTQATVAMPPRSAVPSASKAPLPLPTPSAAKAVPATTAPASPAKTPPTFATGADNDATREMPRPNRATAPASQPAKQAVAPKKPEPAKFTATKDIQVASELHNLVIADAVRLLNWGRRWHELAELIARMADRPKLPEVRRILRSHRAAIEMRAAEETKTEEDEEKE